MAKAEITRVVTTTLTLNEEETKVLWQAVSSAFDSNHSGSGMSDDILHDLLSVLEEAVAE